MGEWGTGNAEDCLNVGNPLEMASPVKARTGSSGHCCAKFKKKKFNPRISGKRLAFRVPDLILFLEGESWV